MRTDKYKFWQIDYEGFTNHLAVYVNEVKRIILNLFIFFLPKHFKRKKAPKAKQATFTPVENCARKKLLPLLFFVHLFLFC